MSFPIAILAGGLGTRLHPLTLDRPKSLVSVNGYPFIGWQLKLLKKSGVDSVVLCLGHKARDVLNFVGTGENFGIKVQYSIEEEPLGTGGALKKALPLLGDLFGVLYGDSYLPVDYLKVLDTFKRIDKLGLMTIYRNQGHYDVSNVALDTSGNIRYSKKSASTGMEFIDYGLSYFRKEALRDFVSFDKFDLADALESLSLDGQIASYEVRNRFYEVGSFRGILDLERYLEREQI
jgi:NDP-sugar pyrophosphorylase family protein